MVRHYSKKRVAAYSSQQLQDALNNVRQGAMSFRQASSTFNVPLATLHDNISGKTKAEKAGHPTALSKTEEDYIVSALLYAAECGWPLNRDDLKAMVMQFSASQSHYRAFPWLSSGPGPDFIRGFEKRWSHVLAKRSPELLTMSRAKSLSGENVNAFFDMVSKVYEEHQFSSHPDRCYNLDEAGFSTDEKAKECFFRRGIHFVPNLSATCGKTMYSVLVCGNATGQLMPPFVVYKGCHLYDSWLKGGPEGTRYAVTNSGWMEGHSCEEWFSKTFIPYKVAQHKDNFVAVFMDGHGSHLTYRLASDARKSNVVLICLPPNCSHALQPLDVGFFKPMKQVWRGILRAFFRESRHASVDKSVFPTLLRQTWEKVKKENMVAGFAASGLFPLDRSKPLKKVLPTAAVETNQAGEVQHPELHEAILKILSPPPSKDTENALRNKRGGRKRVQALQGEVLTTDEALARREEEERSGPNTKKFSSEAASSKSVPAFKVCVVEGPNTVEKDVISVPGDGDCLFACFAEAVHGNHLPETVQAMRKRAVAGVVADFQRFATAVQHCHNSFSAAAYKQMMEHTKEQADEPEIISLSEAFNVRVVIYKGPPSKAPWLTSFNDQCQGKLVRLHLYQHHYSLLKDKYNVGDWVVVTYDNERYPGEVVDATASEYKVNVMKRSLMQKWTWPKNRDAIFYEEKDIIQKIAAPIQVGNRGQFSIADFAF